MIVEDGTGKGDADSLVSLDDASRYQAARGRVLWSTASEDSRSTALVVGTDYVESTYRNLYPGFPKFGRAQALGWPRLGAYVQFDNHFRDELSYFGSTYYWYDGLYYVDDSSVPREVKAAVCEAAYRELVKPGSLMPDLKRGGAIQSVSAGGGVSVTYAAGASATTSFQSVDSAIAPILVSVNPYCGRVTR